MGLDESAQQYSDLRKRLGGFVQQNAPQLAPPLDLSPETWARLSQLAYDVALPDPASAIMGLGFTPIQVAEQFQRGITSPPRFSHNYRGTSMSNEMVEKASQELAERGTAAFPSRIYDPISGVVPVTDPRASGWLYMPASKQTDFARRFKGELIDRPSYISYPANELEYAMRSQFPEPGTVDLTRMQNLFRQAGGKGAGQRGAPTPEESWLDQIASFLHEIGHEAAERINNQTLRDILRLPKKTPIDYLDLNDKSVEALARNFFADESVLKQMPGVPNFIKSDTIRPMYWLHSGSSSGRVGEEALADFFALQGLGFNPNTLFQQSFATRDPLLELLR